MTIRVLWGACLALGAMVTCVGIELHASGAGPVVSFPVVAAGILFLPLASTGIQHILKPGTSSPH
jgi:hypothetical protein